MPGHIGKHGRNSQATVLPPGAMPHNDGAPEDKMSRSTVRGTGSTPVLTASRREGSESGQPDRRQPGARVLCVDHASGKSARGGHREAACARRGRAEDRMNGGAMSIMGDITTSQDGAVRVALPMIEEILADLVRAVEDTEARLARLERIAPEKKKPALP